ncbi:hypothetical protein R3P38DRAFT_3032173 [Favolaschia claudopus]|uniref:MYND-type domain-containing protein n=1 Tax=Favolaschia claudopus TaxID=2862362 RepID=A0AAW0ADE0_9AGAR
MSRLCAGPSCFNTDQTANQLRLCGKCKAAHYCSKECQRRHWPSHRLFCQKQGAQISMVLAECPSLHKTYSLWRKSMGAFLCTWICVQGLVLKFPHGYRTKFMVLSIIERKHNPSLPLTAFAFHDVSIRDTCRLQDLLRGDTDEVGSHMVESERLAKRHGHIGAALLVIQATSSLRTATLVRAVPVVLTLEDMAYEKEEHWEDMTKVIINEAIDWRRMRTWEAGLNVAVS